MIRVSNCQLGFCSRGTRVWGLIIRYGMVAIAITSTGAIAGLVSVLGSGVGLLLLSRGEEGTSASVLTGIAAWIGCSSLISLLEGNVAEALCSGMAALVLLSIGILKFWDLVQKIERVKSL